MAFGGNSDLGVLQFEPYALPLPIAGGDTNDAQWTP